MVTFRGIVRSPHLCSSRPVSSHLSLSHALTHFIRSRDGLFRRPLAWVLGSSLLIVTASCRSPEATEPQGPALTLIRSTKLAESDSFFVGRPLGFAIGSESFRYLVSDLAAGRVLAWDNAGQAATAWGRVGRGPGEFLGPAAVVRQADLLWVADFGSISWKAVRISDGTEVARYTVSGTISHASPNFFADTLFFGLNDPVNKSALGLLIPKDSAIVQAVSIPAEYTRLADAGIGRFSAVFPAMTDKWRVVGFGALDGLYLLDKQFSVVDSIVLPRVSRRGVSATRYRMANGGFASAMNSVSVLSLLRPLANSDRLLAVHYDNEVQSDDLPLITAVLYVTVVDLASRTACVETRVPRVGIARPTIQVSGDTLFVLRQEAGERVETFVDQYIIETSQCRWIKMKTGAMLLEAD